MRSIREVSRLVSAKLLITDTSPVRLTQDVIESGDAEQDVLREASRFAADTRLFLLRRSKGVVSSLLFSAHSSSLSSSLSASRPYTISMTLLVLIG